MTEQPAHITGVILAGGLARRMNHQDKGLIHYRGQPLIHYAVTAMMMSVDTVLINANRNHDRYAQFGLAIIADQNETFDGPLAGILTAMLATNDETLLVIPCDCPLIQSHHLNQLLVTLAKSQADIAIAYDGERFHPVFLALKTHLKTSLNDYLNQGGRKIFHWLQQHVLVKVDFSQHATIFFNINTLDDLLALEKQQYQPQMSHAKITVSSPITAIDETGHPREIYLVDERPLTIYVDKQEIVTLMTMGTHPELLTLGYLKNQEFFDEINEIKAIQVDWEVNAVTVITSHQHSNFSKKMQQRTITTGCGQGTVFGRLMDKLNTLQVARVSLPQSHLYAMLSALKVHNNVYKQAGAVHGCALSSQEGKIEFFVEDVGRHNAVDVIAGYMWLNRIPGDDKIFYTTGRLTSEMVIKIAQMQIPVLLSRSGATQMGVNMAKQSGVVLISRAKGRHFLILNQPDAIIFEHNTDET